MKKTFLSILFLIFLFPLNSFAQEEENEIEHSLSIYASFQYLPTGNLPNYYFDLPNFSYNSTALGIYRENKSKNRFIEFSLSFSKRSDEGNVFQSMIDTSTLSNPPVMFFTNTYFGKSNELNIGLRFERGRWIERISNEKIKIGFSSSFRAFVHSSDLTSSDPGLYARERDQYYLAFGLVPRIRYNVTSKFYLSLHFPFEMVGLGVEFGETRNPNLSENQQKESGGSFDIGGEALIRFGMGYKF